MKEKPSELVIKVLEIKGHCPVYRLGSKFRMVEGFKLLTDEPLCMPSLVSLFPY